MKTFQSTGLSEYKGTLVNNVRQEQQGKRFRYVKCKAIYLGTDCKMYAMWQYVSAKNSFNPSGKSTVFFEAIPE